MSALTWANLGWGGDGVNDETISLARSVNEWSRNLAKEVRSFMEQVDEAFRAHQGRVDALDRRLDVLEREGQKITVELPSKTWFTATDTHDAPVSPRTRKAAYSRPSKGDDQ